MVIDVGIKYVEWFLTHSKHPNRNEPDKNNECTYLVLPVLGTRFLISCHSH